MHRGFDEPTIENVSLACAVQGFSFPVEYKVQKDSEVFVRSCLSEIGYNSFEYKSLRQLFNECISLCLKYDVMVPEKHSLENEISSETQGNAKNYKNYDMKLK